MIGSSRAWQLLTGLAGAWLLTSSAVTGCFAERDLTEVVGAGGAPTASCPGELCAAFLRTCTDGQRDGDETGTDCGGSCARCPDGQPCLTGADCQSAVCTAARCAPPACDDGARNGAETDVDCGGTCDQGCAAGQRCGENTDCAGEQCSGPNGTCLPTCTDGVTNGGETDVDCGGPCKGCQVGLQCAGSSLNCEPGTYCEGTVCEKLKGNGVACESAEQCVSGFRADEVCCNDPCTEPCRACNLGASTGTCKSIPSGDDPANECAGDDVCDGNGACKKAPGATCALGSECASGECWDDVCCETACTDTCWACNEAATGKEDGQCAYILAGLDPHEECDGNDACWGNGACAMGKSENGLSCASAFACASNYCADGVCCATPCQTPCMGCALTGLKGICSPLPAGAFDGCPGGKPCDGNGACTP
ncbi:MAG: hypothetical protein R3B70_34935 [Polyangiaceae bacterium]